MTITPAFHLPTDAVLVKKKVQAALEFRPPRVRVVAFGNRLVEAFGDVIDPVPGGVIDQIRNLALDVSRRPVVRVRSLEQNLANSLAHSAWSKTAGIAKHQHAVAHNVRRVFSDGDLGVWWPKPKSI